MSESLLFRTLRGRLMLVASLATLPAFLFVVYVAAKERSAALDRAEADARYVASLASREHAHQVSGAARLLERLASGSAPRNSERELRTLLPAVLAGFPQIANLGILSASGDLQFSVVPPPLPIAMSANPAFREALHSAGVAVGGYQVGPIVGRPVLIIAHAVRDAERQPRFVLFAALELAWLDELARQANLPPQHTLLIVDRNGAVLARSSAEAAGGAPPAQIAPFTAMVARTQGMTRYTENDGIARLGVAAPLEGTRDVAIVVGLPESSVYGMANRVFYRDVAVLALLALLAVASSVLAIDVSLLRDVRLLAHATRRFGEGDFSARAPLPGPKGEIRDLARAFNAMANALAAGHRESMNVQDQLRALTHRLLSVREEEAARIAQELHDELGQELSVLKLELEHLRRKVLAGRSPEAHEAVSVIDEIGDRVDGAVQSVRRISSDLRPGVLDRLGLVAGLEWLLHEFGRRSGLETALTARGVREPVAAEVSTALFRITQEALTNVVRHAHATRVSAELEERGEKLALTITDDGTGFDPGTAESTPSLGLLGIRERAARLGGEVQVQSAPGSGTVLAVMVDRAPPA